MQPAGHSFTNRSKTTANPRSTSLKVLAQRFDLLLRPLSLSSRAFNEFFSVLIYSIPTSVQINMNCRKGEQEFHCSLLNFTNTIGASQGIGSRRLLHPDKLGRYFQASTNFIQSNEKKKMKKKKKKIEKRKKNNKLCYVLATKVNPSKSRAQLSWKLVSWLANWDFQRCSTILKIIGDSLLFSYLNLQ